MKLNNNRKKRVFWGEFSDLDRRLEESKDEEKLKVVKEWILGICQFGATFTCEDSKRVS
jgi:hypothetical protein